MRGLVFLIPGLPLLGFAINLLFGRYLPKRLVGWLATAVVGGAFVIAIVEYLHLLSMGVPRLETGNLFTWFQVGGLKIAWGFYLDPLSAAMILFVTGVAALIHAYSIGYMDHDPRFRTFFVYLNLFVFSMLTLVLANNFVLTFLGWEGVGACSYWLRPGSGPPSHPPAKRRVESGPTCRLRPRRRGGRWPSHPSRR